MNAPPRKKTVGTAALEARGILDVARAYRWEDGKTGWHYPVFDCLTEEPVLHGSKAVGRFKAYPLPEGQEKPKGWAKYRWTCGGQPANKDTNPIPPELLPYFYVLPGTHESVIESIEDTGAILHMTSGEPDTLVMHAAGFPNSVCRFGEGRSMTDLPAMLAKYFDFFQSAARPDKLYLYPDLDPTGLRWALHIWDALYEQRMEGTIQVCIVRLPGTLGLKGDLNKLWQGCGFDSPSFRSSLHDLYPPELLERAVGWFDAFESAQMRPQFVETFDHLEGLRTEVDFLSFSDLINEKIRLAFQTVLAERRQYTQTRMLNEPSQASQNGVDSGASQVIYQDTPSRGSYPLNLPKNDVSWKLSDTGSKRWLEPSYYQAIADRLEAKHGKGYPVRCPFHDDKHSSAQWNDDSDYFEPNLYCHVCGRSYSCRDLAEHFNIDYHQYIPVVSCRTSTVSALAEETKPEAYPTQIIPWQSVSDDHLALLHGEVQVSTYPPMAAPWSDMRRMGGQAEFLEPGEVMGIVGGSGWGKTSLLECWIDHQRQRGFNGLIWGPEKDPIKYLQRAIQRQGGPSVNEVKAHKRWLQEEARQTKTEDRTGRRLSDEAIGLSSTLADQIGRWPGKLAFLQAPGATIDDLLNERPDRPLGLFPKAAQAAEKVGQHVDFAALDYLNLVQPDNGEEEGRHIERCMIAFKAFCARYGVVGVEVFQIDKATTQSILAREKRVTMESMLRARPFTLSLILTLARVVSEQGQYTPVGKMRVAKNSEGQMGDFELVWVESKAIWGTQARPRNEPPLKDRTISKTEAADDGE